MLNQFQLSEPEIEDVKTLTSVRKKYSEVFLKFDQNCQVLRILSSPSEYWVCTTDPEDYKKEFDIRKTNPEIKELDVLKQLAAGGKS